MNVPINDWIIVIAGALGWLVWGLQKIAPNLPSNVQKIIKKLSQQEIIEIIIWVNENCDTPEHRRETAVQLLQELAEKKLGFKLPTSIANLIVEWAVQQYKRLHG